MADEAVAVFNPFPGLRSFEPEETHLFFGRDGQGDELLRILAQNRFAAVVGTSGSGKSSLVKAGVLPALERGFMIAAGSSWRIAAMRPGANPVESLGAVLNDSVAAASGELDLKARRILIDTTLRRNSFGLIEAARLTRTEPHENLLVVVDQFEELFRLGPFRANPAVEEESAMLVRLLLEAVRQTAVPVYVLLTMRSDFLGDCARFRDLPETLNRAQYLIPRMTREQRRQAIEGPVAVGGAAIAPRLVQRLLNDVGDDPDQLPILQHALMRTWEAWRRAGNLTAPIDLEHYESIGGMAEALSRHAEEAYGELGEPGQEIARRLFQAITEKGFDNRAIRRPTRLGEICAVADAPQDAVIAAIDCFRTNGRTFLMPSAPAALGPNSIIDISHESLIRLWGRLGQWTDEEAESAATYKRLADDAARHKIGRAALWRDPGLALALQWKNEQKPNVAWAGRYAPGFEGAMDFLERSRRAGETAKMLRRGAVAGLAAVAVIFLVLAWAAYRNEQKANQASALALARQLVDDAKDIETDSPELLERSALLAVESAKRDPLLENDLFLRHAAALLEKPVLRLGKFADRVTAISFSPNAKLLAVAAGDTAAVFQTATGRRVSQLTHGGPVNAIAFSPDGRYVATGSSDSIAWVFDAATGREVSKLAEDGPVLAIAFSPDGRYAATGGFDKTARVFDALTGREVSRLKHDLPVEAVAFSPDGRYVATASEDRTARVFDAASGREVSRLKHDLPVEAVAFSPDGRYVATGSADGTARVFEAATGKETAQFRHSGTVNAVAFSPGGRYLATGSDDKTARVFDLQTGTQVSQLLHGDAVAAVAFSPDGRLVATGSRDKTTRVFEAATGWELARLAHDGAVNVVAFSPGGHYVATGGDGKTVELFATAKQGEVSLRTHDAGIVAVAFSPDGRFVATGSKDKTERLFDAATGKELSRLNEDDPVLAVAISPTGRYLATGDKDGAAMVFDRTTGKPVSPRLKHGGSVNALAFSPDERLLATGSVDGATSVFEVAGGKRIAKVKHDNFPVDAVVFSPDGRYVAAGGVDGAARVFEAAGGKETATLKHGSTVDAVAFSPDGRYLATGSKDQTARLFELAAGKQVLQLPHRAAVDAVAFSPDGRYLITSSGDKTVHVFDAASGDEVSRIPGEYPVLHMATIRNGANLITESRAAGRPEFDLATYPLAISDLIDEVCARLDRNLTPGERKQYLRGQPADKTCPNLP